jgi:biopolymer transport protein ExbD
MKDMKDDFAQINIIPLVDILLVLLVIVLITANFAVQGKIGMNLPQSKTAEKIDQKPLQIAVSEDGVISFDDKPVAIEELGLLFVGIPKDTPFLISADKNTRLQIFVSLIEALKALGFTKIGVHTINS